MVLLLREQSALVSRTAMQTIEIPRDTWMRRLNEFTRVNEGRPASVDVLGPDLGAQPEVDRLPLIGVSADRVDHDGTIIVSVARSTDGHLTHVIERVTHVYLERSEDGVEMALRIVSADGTTTLVRLQAPVAISRRLG
jgi:hypothetical protein